MMNQVMLIGKLVKINGNTITLSSTRNYKNSEGLYDTDYIPCILDEQTFKNAIEYIAIGDVVGVKGRIQCLNTADKMEISVEKLTFISSKKADE